MSPTERLLFQQDLSGALTEQVQNLVNEQIGGNMVEAKSGLGQAISYMLEDWEAVTLFF